MKLDDVQRDALGELINVAFGRAAAAFSKLTKHRVRLEAPALYICQAAQLADTLRGVFTHDVATVHLIFTGPVAGDALLVLDQHAASTLKELLTDEAPLPLADDSLGQEVVRETGNVLLNACLGTLGNILDVHVTFTVPRLTLESLDGMVRSLQIGQHAVRYALVAHTAFQLREKNIEGYIVIVLTVESLHRLVEAATGGVEG